jgi:DNA polymerase-3 subunit alpha (Gram-positive type)
MVDKIIKINVPDEFNRRDNSSQPRIELLAHTKMSAFDGITPVSDLIKRSKHFGASVIGITDRNNVQAYPQIMEEAKKQKQKIIYGAELDVSERDICIVKNSISQSLEHGEYVIFDIETTGLVNEFDELIEFGAVKIKDGAILDQVD